MLGKEDCQVSSLSPAPVDPPEDSSPGPSELNPGKRLADERMDEGGQEVKPCDKDNTPLMPEHVADGPDHQQETAETVIDSPSTCAKSKVAPSPVGGGDASSCASKPELGGAEDIMGGTDGPTSSSHTSLASSAREAVRDNKAWVDLLKALP